MILIHFAFRDWLYSLTIGFLVVSYWRSSWVLLDILGCDQPSDATLANGNSFCFAVPAAENPQGSYGMLRLKNARISYAAGIALLFTGIALMNCGFWLPDRNTLKVTPRLGLTRFVMVYILGASAVCIWRGIWYWADAWILPDNPVGSYWLTSLVGAGAAFAMHVGNSLLAPPAIFLLDGPDSDPPPIAGTALGAHYAITLHVNEKRPRVPIYVDVLDVVFSFGVVPFAVVWFWRGSWMLLDYYFWGFNASDRDVHISILWSILMFVLCIWLTSEPVVGIFDKKIGENKLLLGMLGRFRTYVLAWGTVSFWRCVWLIWDEFLGGTSLLSTTLGHVLPLLLLTAMGGVSCINAPASTIGVDSIPHCECEDEPLFSMVPLPWEALYAFGLFRQVDKSKVDDNKRFDEPQVASTGDIEITSGKEEHIESSEGNDDGKIYPPDVKHETPAVSLSLRSGRSGLSRTDGSSSRTLDLVKPGLRLAVCTQYSQRPDSDNPRSRSRLFRSR